MMMEPINIYKIKAPLGYSTGTPLYPIVKAMFDKMNSASSCKPKTQLTLANYVNANPLVYPLIVTKSNGVELGTVANATAYMTVWNADPDNQTLGRITAGSGLVFDFEPIYINTAVTLYAKNTP